MGARPLARSTQPDPTHQRYIYIDRVWPACTAGDSCCLVFLWWRKLMAFYNIIHIFDIELYFNCDGFWEIRSLEGRTTCFTDHWRWPPTEARIPDWSWSPGKVMACITKSFLLLFFLLVAVQACPSSVTCWEDIQFFTRAKILVLGE